MPSLTQLPNIKQLFIPDEGMEIADCDLCLTEDHEILTENGWINLKTYVETKHTAKIACWCAQTDTISFLTPIEHIHKPYTGYIYEYEGKVSIKGTANHKQPMITRGTQFKKIAFKDLFFAGSANYFHIHSSYTTGTTLVNANYLLLLVATQSDGCFIEKNSAYLRFSFKKEDKKCRLVKILRALKINYREQEDFDNYTHYYLAADEPYAIRLLNDLTFDKNFPIWLLQLEGFLIYAFIEELRYWDDKIQKLDNFNYSSNNFHNISLVQALCALCGKYGVIVKQDALCYDLYISNKKLSQDIFNYRVKTPYVGEVYCVTVPTNYFICKRNNKVCITGNSGADIQIVAWDSECKWLIDYFSNPANKMKVYKYISSMYLQREITDDEYRDQKAIYHGSNYGLGIDELAVMAKLPKVRAKGFQDYYFSLNPEIRLWQKRIIEQIKTYGFVENIFGRRGYFLNSNDATLQNKAFAFKPQSTIGDVINRAWIQNKKSLASRGLRVLMQTHDSLLFQYPAALAEELRQKIMKNMRVRIPYKNELIIPADMKISRVSYGDMEKVKL